MKATRNIVVVSPLFSIALLFFNIGLENKLVILLALLLLSLTHILNTLIGILVHTMESSLLYDEGFKTTGMIKIDTAGKSAKDIMDEVNKATKEMIDSKK